MVLILLSLSILSCKKEKEEINKPNNLLSDTAIYNMAYGPDLRNVYDIYLPANRDSSTPVILMIHGGAWIAGQKEDFNAYVKLIQANWDSVAIVNMNYRLASNEDSIHHEEIMEDIQAMVAHLGSKKEEYKISSKLAIVGASAGAQLAMIYAYKYNSNIRCVADIFGPSIINDWAWYSSTNIWLGGKVGDILAEYVGQSWDTTAYKAVSPYWNISSNSQATIIFHGSFDPIVPLSHSKLLHAKLNSLGVENEYHEYPAFHGFNTTQSADVIGKMVQFFKPHLD